MSEPNRKTIVIQKVDNGFVIEYGPYQTKPEFVRKIAGTKKELFKILELFL